jgi:DNA repair protein RadC
MSVLHYKHQLSMHCSVKKQALKNIENVQNYLKHNYICDKEEAEMNILIKEQEDIIYSLNVQIGYLHRKLLVLSAQAATN